MSLAALSPRVNLEQSRKQAKELLRAFRDGDRAVFDHVRWNHPRFRGLRDAEIGQREFRLADAQLVVARLHYFDSWPKLVHHIERLAARDPDVIRFEQASDAIITGDLSALRALLSEHPSLITQRSTRGHHAPLLHYVAANGVENYRQRSPDNIVDVGRVLLDAGAAVDATSDAYGGGWTALGLVATSTPPRQAGVQIPLIDLLLEYGATIDGVKPGESIVLAALHNNCPEAARALVERGATVADVVAAAGVGRLDLVTQLAARSTAEELGRALIMAARHGTYETLEHLLGRGADVAASDGMTALHEAAGRARPDMIELLLRHGAPLEQKNAYGGTVLDSTLWFADHADPFDAVHRDYGAVVDRLIAAGARTDLYPEMSRHIDEVRRRGKGTVKK